MTCFRCQEQNPAHAKFCLECGTPFRKVNNGESGASYADLQHALTEAHAQMAGALDRQAATSEILRVISTSPSDVQSVFDAIVSNAVRLCGASHGGVYRFDGTLVHSVAHDGYSPEQLEDWRKTWPRPVTAASAACQAIRTRSLFQIADVENTPSSVNLTPETLANLRARHSRSIVAVPMFLREEVVGAISLAHPAINGFSDGDIELLRVFADQAVIAIENVRLFTELQEKNRAVTAAHAQVSESLEQQTATSEILHVISISPTDVLPVLDAVATRAARLCEALDATILLRDGDAVVPRTHSGPLGAPFGQRQRVTREWVTGRAVLEARTIHVPDLLQSEEFPEGRELAIRYGHRATLVVPLLRDGIALGAVLVRRREALPFTAKQIELLQTFADQAVIAIENVRLFTELQASNRELTTALDTQTATSYILRVISRSQTDVQPVFDAIVASAVRLLQAYASALTRVVNDRIELAAFTRTDDAGAAALMAAFPQSLQSELPHAQAIRTRAPLNIADAQTDPRLPEAEHARARVRGFRSRVLVPLLLHDEAIGALSVTRRELGGFNADEISLLETFADQAVIAIENVRLFKELEAANRDLSAASQHKSEFLANMSHELRTPLNAVIGFSEVLTQRMFGELNEKQDEYLKDIYASGQHLLSLINDILDLSKIEAGRMDLELGDFHLPTVIDNTLILVRERAMRRGITLEQAIDSRLGEMRGDERKVKQVLLNLLSNAIKFTPDGGRINVQAVFRDAFIDVSVSDTGVGIAPGDQEAIFEEFRQVGTTSKKVEGTGLGLTLSRKFVELHGGKIWVESQLGTGSTFKFTLPMRCGD